MRPARTAHDRPAAWDVVRPVRPGRLSGVSMAGFRDRGTSPLGHRAIAHPAVTLVIDFGPRPLVVRDASGRERRGSLVAPMGFGSVTVGGSDFEALQVRLSPVVARSVLGISPSELAGGVATLDDVWGADAARLRERLVDASSWEERFTLADAALARRQEEARAVDPEVGWAWGLVVRSGGRVRVDALAAEVGWSRRRLWSRFEDQLGVPPKRAATLVRFDRAVHLLAAGAAPAQVAADAGYADQSHLHRHVVAFSGTTPATVASAPWLAIDDVAWPSIVARPTEASGRATMPTTWERQLPGRGHARRG